MARLFKPATESWRFVLEADRKLPPEQQTVFVLSPLIQGEIVAVEDAITRTVLDRQGRPNLLSRERQSGRDLALEHIESIENFPVGQPKPWPADREARETYLAQLHVDDVHEIGKEIYRKSKVGAEEPAAKNSFMPERTSSSGDISPETAKTT
jgi:hypothetical protein